jgi:hypothetical protein
MDREKGASDEGEYKLQLLGCALLSLCVALKLPKGSFSTLQKAQSQKYYCITTLRIS